MISKQQASIDRIYSRIPRIDCARKCQEACGPILCHSIEFERMESVSLVPLRVIGPNLRCPALSGGACSIYTARPLICRLWGTVRRMACPWGCTPDRWLSDAEASVLLGEMSRLSGGKVDGPAAAILAEDCL